MSCGAGNTALSRCRDLQSDIHKLERTVETLQKRLEKLETRSVALQSQPVQPSQGAHGCKRSGGFVDAGCTAACDCHVTLRFAQPVQPAGKGGAKELQGGQRDYDFEMIDDLVARFATALREKLRASEAKYGHNSGWMRDDWKADCQRGLNEHLTKGDPRDVAAFCAFLWHHGWPTIGPVTIEEYKRIAALPSPVRGDSSK